MINIINNTIAEFFSEICWVTCNISLTYLHQRRYPLNVLQTLNTLREPITTTPYQLEAPTKTTNNKPYPWCGPHTETITKRT